MSTEASVDDAEGLVSVILPTFNRAATLPRAIMSVLDQSYRNLELLIVDDGSRDNTAEIVANIRDPRIRYIPLEINGGASSARNAGLRLAKGAFIAFQDSDDEWLGGKLEKQVRAAQAAGEAAVTVFHPKILYGRDDAGRYGPHRVCLLPIIENHAEADFKHLIHLQNLISTQTLFITREAFERAGFFDVHLVNSEDWAFGIELFYNSKVVFIDEPLVMSYLQNDSISMLRKGGAKAQLRVVKRLAKKPDVSRQVIGEHLGRLGWSVAKLGNAKRGRLLLVKSLMLQPMSWRNWARLATTQVRITFGASHGRFGDERPSAPDAAYRR
jgi:glycosyltransferase involved in cell wall biosynthesis